MLTGCDFGEAETRRVLFVALSSCFAAAAAAQSSVTPYGLAGAAGGQIRSPVRGTQVRLPNSRLNDDTLKTGAQRGIFTAARRPTFDLP
jgi:predicted porin